EAVEILEENFGDLVFKTRIKKTIRYAEAPVKGTSVLKYDPTGKAANAYRDLAKEVLNGAKARQHAWGPARGGLPGGGSLAGPAQDPAGRGARAGSSCRAARGDRRARTAV